MPTGIAIALPEGYVGLVHPRSGLAARLGVSIVNAPGTVDAGYRGEVKVLLVNLDPRHAGATCAAATGSPSWSSSRWSTRASSRCERSRARPAAWAGTVPRAVSAPPAAHHGGAAVRFGRKKDEAVGDSDADAPDRRSTPAIPGSTVRGTSSEVAIAEDDDSRLDLGSLLVTPRADLELQLQVDEASGQVVAVVLAGEQGAAELRVFAAPRNGDIWEGVRRTMSRRGRPAWAAPPPRPRGSSGRS